MNIYEKLNEVRNELQSTNIKKSGFNKFAKYNYFELSDILPVVNTMCKDKGLICLVSFGREMAEMTIKNTENIEEEINFYSPMSKADLKGCHEVQNLGAVQTYIRRYLYMTAFEIVESDALDSTQGNQQSQQAKQQPKKEEPTRLMSEENYNELQSALQAKHGSFKSKDAITELSALCDDYSISNMKEIPDDIAVKIIADIKDKPF